MPQVLITPHVAGITEDSMIAMGGGAARAVGELLRGERAAALHQPAGGPGLSSARGGAEPRTALNRAAAKRVVAVPSAARRSRERRW